MSIPVHAGGSFAPRITEDTLVHYEALAALVSDSRIRESMTELIAMCRAFLLHPEASGPGSPHATGRGSIVPLDDAVIQEIWDLVPWQDEIDLMAGRFELINAVTEKETRDAAHHLLWYARELTMDRRPITADTL